MPNVFAWFNANYINGFGNAQPADGAAIAQWNDLTPNARHLVQATGANQPIFRATGGPNNLPSVNFVDTSDLMNVAIAGTFARPITLIAVFKNTLADDNFYHTVADFNAERIGLGLDWLTGNVFTPRDDTTTFPGGSVPGDTTTYHLQSFLAAPSGGTSIASTDGIHNTSAGLTGTNTNSNITVAVGQGFTTAFIGHLCEYVIFTGELSRPMMLNLEQGMMEAWGLLPSYKLAS
jgi:hypothetical protein